MPINNILKRIILGFTILCAILLIIFTVELIRINRDTREENNGQSVSDGSQSENGSESPEPGRESPDATGGEKPVDTPNSGLSVTGSPPSGNQRPPPTGTRRERPLPDNMTLVFYAENEVFTHIEYEQEDLTDKLIFRGDGTAELHFYYVFIPGELKTYSISFLTDNYGVIGATAGDEDYISLSPYRGVMASGEISGLYYEAWVHRFTKPGSEDLGLALILIYQNETQKNALYSVLDSMEVD